jgi:hypothetical protein
MRTIFGPALAVWVLASACMGCAGSAQSTTPTSRPTAQSPTEDDEYICTDETPTGSAIPRQICRRKDDIREERDQTRRDLSKPQNRPEKF